MSESSIILLYKKTFLKNKTLNGNYELTKNHFLTTNTFFPPLSIVNNFKNYTKNFNNKHKKIFYKEFLIYVNLHRKTFIKSDFYNKYMNYYHYFKKFKNIVKNTFLYFSKYKLNFVKKIVKIYKEATSNLRDGLTLFKNQYKLNKFNKISLINTNFFYKIKKTNLINTSQNVSNINLIVGKEKSIVKLNILFKKRNNMLVFISNTFLIKYYYLFFNIKKYFDENFNILKYTNLIPNYCFFNLKLKKYIYSTNSNVFFKENVTNWVYTNFVRFIEFCLGKKVFLNLNSFLNQHITLDYVILYKKWIERLYSYEKKLGHKFFLEEALHVIHISFKMHDVNLITNWLTSIIKRISFWKTRTIFRFLKYLFNNYFMFIFNELNILGFKIKLKGKISVAGNSRKRSILYRVNKTSHSTYKLKVLHKLSLINTFTGVLGLHVWIFY